MENKLIAIVEDDPDVARTIEFVLKDFGFTTVLCRTGQELFRRLQTITPDACIIDLGLPDMDGIEVMQKVRTLCACGILILTGRSHVSDKVMGLELGADDYVIKPFEPRELVARVRSIIRRNGAPTPEAGTSQREAIFSGWRFNATNNLLTGSDGGEAVLSTAEAELLAIFLANPNRIVHRDKLLGSRGLTATDRSLDVRISRLRKKLEADPDNPKLIVTIYGAGYLLKSGVVWE